jgi:hypothetical protein
MTIAPLRPSDRRQALAGLQAAVGSVARPNPLVLAWRWRYELTLAAAITTGVIALWRAPLAAQALAAGLAGIAGAALWHWPPARRLAIARAWCVITPHRVRAGCAGAWIHSRGGRLPAVLLTTRESFGERVHLWCHAGSCAQDFESARELLIAACWAQNIRVTCNPRYQQLVTLEVIRRPGSTPPRHQQHQPDASSETGTANGYPRRSPPAAVLQNGHRETR